MCDCKACKTRKVFYPTFEVVLPGVTDIFPYQSVLVLKSGIIIALHELTPSQITSIALDGGITVQNSVVEASSQTNAGALSGALIVSTDFDPELSKAIEVNSSVKIVSALDVACNLSTDDIASVLYFSGNISEIDSLISITMPGTVRLIGDISESQIIKYLENIMSCVTVYGDLLPTSSKSIVLDGTQLIIGGDMDIQTVRLRRLGDLAGLTLGDLSTWTLNTFFYKEE